MQRDEAVKKSVTHRAAGTVAEKLQHFPIAKALAEQTSVLHATAAALGKAWPGWCREQKRIAWCAQACGLHRGEDSPCSVRRFAHAILYRTPVFRPFCSRAIFIFAWNISGCPDISHQDTGCQNSSCFDWLVPVLYRSWAVFYFLSYGSTFLLRRNHTPNGILNDYLCAEEDTSACARNASFGRPPDLVPCLLPLNTGLNLAICSIVITVIALFSGMAHFSAVVAADTFSLRSLYVSNAPIAFELAVSHKAHAWLLPWTRQGRHSVRTKNSVGYSLVLYYQ